MPPTEYVEYFNEIANGFFPSYAAFDVSCEPNKYFLVRVEVMEDQHGFSLPVGKDVSAKD